MSANEYAMFVVVEGNNIALQILTDCPLHDLHGGKCSSCSLFKGLNPKIFREGRCGVAQFYKPIDEFRYRRTCPNPNSNGGDCHGCEHCLGFADNRGFYCSANKEK